MRLYFYIYFVSHNNIESRFEIEKEIVELGLLMLENYEFYNLKI